MDVGVLGMERLSLKRLSAVGLWEGSFAGDPERYVGLLFLGARGY
jgi:hypothetical protein